MKILHIYKDFAPLSGGGGVARHIYALSNETAKKGFSVTVAAPNPESIKSNYKCIDLNSVNLSAAIKSNDLIHIHGARVTLAAKSALLATIYRKKVVYTPHCYYDNGNFLNKIAKIIWDKTIERFIIHKASKVILLTESWIDYLQSRGLKTHNCVVIPNCVDLNKFPSEDLPSTSSSNHDQLNIFYMGRVDPVKRIGDLLTALQSPKLSKAKLHIVGKGTDLENLKSQADDYNLSSRVMFHGYLDDESAFALAKKCDVFVLPSQEEGLPTILLEMIFSGVPIICTRIPGNLAITQKLQIESTYDVGDINQLIDRLKKVQTTYDDKLEHYNKAKKLFSWQHRVQNIVDCYEN